MSIEQQLREHYQGNHITDVVGGPDLGEVLDRGRRRRRARYAGLAGAAAAGIAVGAVVTASLAGGGSSTDVSDTTSGDVAAAPHQAASGPADFVPGTDIDDTLQQVVASHLPALGAPDDVYPSDWFATGPIPDADFADATDWQAAYSISGSERALVVMGYADPNEPAGCPQCDKESVPGGTLMTQVSRLQGSGELFFMTSLVRDDGFTVAAIDYVTADRLADARQARSISDADAASVVRDPRMEFPAPVDPPTGP